MSSRLAISPVPSPSAKYFNMACSNFVKRLDIELIMSRALTSARTQGGSQGVAVAITDERLQWNLLARRSRLCFSQGMSIHLSNALIEGLPQEPMLLKSVSVRLVEPAERSRFDELLCREHYLKNATVVGQVLRYVAEYQGQWLALVVFSSAAFHIKPRDRWLHWSARQVAQRRHLIAQNQRFLVLAAPGRWPNLASRVLKLICDRLSQDWQQHFGHPVLAVETFVDPQQFRGTC